MRWDILIPPGKQGLISLWAPATLPELAVFFQRRQLSQEALCPPTHASPDLCHRAKAGRTFHHTGGTGTGGGALLCAKFYLSFQNPRELLCSEAGMDVSDVERTL